MDDPYDLARYVLAQQPVYARVCGELAAARKHSHWMWFIFPQLQGLGASPTAAHYAIGSLAEARAYLAHPLLGARLRECTQLVNRIQGRTAQAIFGYPDELKFRSCMTLFAHASGERAAPGHAGATGETGASPSQAEGVFREALRRYFAGEEDPLTRRLLTSAV
jgi:uncharacterized protein (DUF1810 family)